MNSNILMIIGMGRSGTSVITQWINKCGLSVGEELLGAAIGNVEGHFEDMDFLKIHEEILVNNNLSSMGLEGAHTIDVSAEQKEIIQEIIERKNKLHFQWGWKEPRTCLFLPLYKELLPQAKYLIIVRDHTAVTDSLLRRDFAYIEKEHLAKNNKISNFIWTLFNRKKERNAYYALNAEKYLKTCIAYNQEIINAMKLLTPDDYMVVSYQYLKHNSKKVFERLTRSWKFDLTYVDFNTIYKAKLLHEKNKIRFFIKDKSLLYKAEELEIIIKTHIKR